MHTSGIKAFIFDMDGTVVNNMGVHFQSWRLFFAELGVAISDQELRRQVNGQPNAAILREVLGSHLSEAEIARLGQRKETLYRDLYRQQIRPLPGLLAFLREAERLGTPMALATNAHRDNVDFVMGNLGIVSFFRVIVSAEDVRRAKPDPEVYLIAARRLGVSAGQCLVFEDSRPGIEAARRAGMCVIALATTHAPDELQGLPVLQVVADYTRLHPATLLDGLTLVDCGH